MGAYRPKTLNDLVGCEDIKKAVIMSITAAKQRNSAFPHTLLYASSGLGKTTLSNLIAKEMGGKFNVYLSNVFRGKEDVQNALAESAIFDGYDDDGNKIDKIKPSIIFLDEIHQLSKRVQESFFQAMEDFTFTVETKNPSNGKTKKEVLWVPEFTLIGATTKPGALDSAFIERFKLKFTIQLYTDEELIIILKMFCSENSLEIEQNALENIAKRARGVARKAINFIERVRDNALFSNQNNIITNDIVDKTFDLLNIDDNGLESLDKQILTYLYKIYPQKIGVNRLAGVFNMDEKVIKEIVEPYLLREELVEATPSGRLLTEKGFIYCEKNGLVNTPETMELGIRKRITNA